MEIEKKYLVKKSPDTLTNEKCYTIEQAYLSDAPVVRVRKRISKKKCEFFLTVKSTGMFAREEVESEISEKTYDVFLQEAKGNVITKERYIIPLENGLKAELDVFKGVFDGVIMVEVEFPDEDVAKKFTPPDFFSEEVTFDKRFHNSNMSKMSKDDIAELISFVKSKTAIN